MYLKHRNLYIKFLFYKINKFLNVVGFKSKSKHFIIANAISFRFSNGFYTSHMLKVFCQVLIFIYNMSYIFYIFRQ
jgi:hypothetical protein